MTRSCSLFEFLCFYILLLTPAHAQEISLAAPKRFVPASGVGLYLSDDGIQPAFQVRIEEKGKDSVKVTIPEMPQTSSGENTFVTGVLFSEEGDISFTPVTRVGSRTSSLALCEENLPSRNQLISQTGVLQSLVEFRSSRTDLTRERFLLRLKKFDKTRLAKLEKGLGLEEAKPLEAETNPYELVTRLSRLLVAIRTYEVHRSSNPNKK
jgi:hypothetical protein